MTSSLRRLFHPIVQIAILGALLCVAFKQNTSPATKHVQSRLIEGSGQKRSEDSYVLSGTAAQEQDFHVVERRVLAEDSAPHREAMYSRSFEITGLPDELLQKLSRYETTPETEKRQIEEDLAKHILASRQVRELTNSLEEFDASPAPSDPVEQTPGDSSSYTNREVTKHIARDASERSDGAGQQK